jgi:hypothetical protein
MFVSTPEPFDVAETVTLRFLIPLLASGKPFETSATVVRAQAGEYMAVRFVRPPEGFREALASFIERKQV